MRWIPLESNPDVMNKYIHGLGVPNEWGFSDVYGLDTELLAMVPKPVLAVLLLYPITEKSEEANSQVGELKENSDVFFMHQTIGNACGTVGIVHAIGNSLSVIKIPENQILSDFFAKLKNLNPDDKAKEMEKDERLSAAHEVSASEGQTASPGVDAKTNLHFVSFIHCGGQLYELDGRRTSPICHGNTTADTLLEDSALVIKKFMERDPEQIEFSVTALSKLE